MAVIGFLQDVMRAFDAVENEAKAAQAALPETLGSLDIDVDPPPAGLFDAGAACVFPRDFLAVM